MAFRNKDKQALLEELIYLCDYVLRNGGFKDYGSKLTEKVTKKYDTYYEVHRFPHELELSLHYCGSFRKTHTLDLDFHPNRFEHNICISYAYVLEDLPWEKGKTWVSFANTKELERILSDWINSIRSPLQVKLYLDILQNQLRGVYYGV